MRRNKRASYGPRAHTGLDVSDVGGALPAKSEMTEKRLTLRMSRKLYEGLRVAAAEHGQSMADYARDTLQRSVFGAIRRGEP